MTALPRPVDPQAAETLYDRDYVEWVEAQAEAVRRLKVIRPNEDTGIDHDNLIEEILDMGRSVERAYRSYLVQIIVHLLKLEFSPADAPRRHWMREVSLFRLSADAEIDDAPSVRRRLDVEKTYRTARKAAAIDLADDGVCAKDLPPTCPYDLDTQILADGWFPENRHGVAP
jgi:hypothetical protein